MSVDEFLEREKIRIMKRELEFKPIYRLTKPEEVVVIDATGSREWRRVKTRYGERVVIPIIVDEKEYVLMLNPETKMYAKLIKTLIEYRYREKNADYIKVKFTRNGRKTYDVELIEDDRGKRK